MALRLKKAMDAFFRRLKAGENPGYPRFRGKGRYDSLTYPQWENGVKLSASGKRLLLSKVGDVKTRLPSSARRDAQDGDHPPHDDGKMVRDHLL